MGHGVITATKKLKFKGPVETCFTAGQIGAKPVSMRAQPPPAKIISCSLYEVMMRKGSRARNSWLAVWADACSLGFDASSVIGLRAMKLAIGGEAAATEAQRMVSEKIEASLALQAKALSGGLGTTALSAAAKTLDHYRQKVDRSVWQPGVRCWRRCMSATSRRAGHRRGASSTNSAP